MEKNNSKRDNISDKEALIIAFSQEFFRRDSYDSLISDSVPISHATRNHSFSCLHNNNNSAQITGLRFRIIIFQFMFRFNSVSISFLFLLFRFFTMRYGVVVIQMLQKCRISSLLARCSTKYLNQVLLLVLTCFGSVMYYFSHYFGL